MTTGTDTSISLSELLDRWRDRDGLSDATRKRERWQAGLVIAHFDGERPARSLSRAEVAEWIGLVSESLASSSARVTIGFLPAEVGPENNGSTRPPETGLAGARMTFLGRAVSGIGSVDPR